MNMKKSSPQFKLILANIFTSCSRQGKVVTTLQRLKKPWINASKHYYNPLEGNFLVITLSSQSQSCTFSFLLLLFFQKSENLSTNTNLLRIIIRSPAYKQRHVVITDHSSYSYYYYPALSFRRSPKRLNVFSKGKCHFTGLARHYCCF